MSDISRIQTATDTYDIKDAVCRPRASIYFVKGPSSNTTAGTWTGTISDLTITAYPEGLTILYIPAVAGGASTTTLNINGCGAKTCYLSNDIKLTTQFAAGTPIMFTYTNNKWMRADQDTTYDRFSDLSRGAGGYVAESIIYQYNLLVQTDANTLAPFNNDSNGSSSTSKTIRTDLEFDAFGQFCQYKSTSTISSGGTIQGSDLIWAKAQMTLTYSFNISSSVNALTANKDTYMKVIPQSNGKVTLASVTPFVHSLPSSPDGYWYIYMGRTMNTYILALYPHHPVYACAGKIVDNNTIALKGKASLEWNATDESIDFVFI